MTEAERLEQESNAARERAAQLMDELRARISPGEVVDQVIDYAGDGAVADFARNLGRQVRRNPLPCVLIGAGLAWLMLADRRPRQDEAIEGRAVLARPGAPRLEDMPDNDDDDAGDLQSAVGAAANRVASTATDAARRAEDAAKRARAATAAGAERASDLAAGISAEAESAYDGARETARSALGRAVGSTSSVMRTVADTARGAGAGLGRLVEEQPLVLAGLGLAIGAALGAVLPATRAENRLVGGASDEVKGRVRALAADGLEAAQSVASRAVGAAAEAAEDVAHRPGPSFGGEHGTARPDEVPAPKASAAPDEGGAPDGGDRGEAPQPDERR
jgi:hypothetical protein